MTQRAFFKKLTPLWDSSGAERQLLLLTFATYSTPSPLRARERNPLALPRAWNRGEKPISYRESIFAAIESWNSHWLSWTECLERMLYKRKASLHRHSNIAALLEVSTCFLVKTHSFYFLFIPRTFFLLPTIHIGINVEIAALITEMVSVLGSSRDYPLLFHFAYFTWFLASQDVHPQGLFSLPIVR